MVLLWQLKIRPNYVKSWLKAGRHEALDKVTGLPKKAIALKRSDQLFEWSLFDYE